ncbi:hypothetical protein ACFFX0_14525 [Citricoccus parietis]|uniref:Uncharacterized protein n=1 Tax=Citricoccus parietis TaxID=592307 RepID=A0ABV5G084_9MICC
MRTPRERHGPQNRHSSLTPPGRGPDERTNRRQPLRPGGPGQCR